MAGFQFPNFQRLVTDFLGFNQFGIEQVRSVEWGKKYLWAVRFMPPATPKAPFDKFFPATDVTVDEGNLDSFNFDQGQSSFSVPQRSNRRQISVTFYDDENHTLLRWLRTWINIDILNGGSYVSCLFDSHRPVADNGYSRVYPIREFEVLKLDNSLVPIDGTRVVYDIYPEGTIEFNGGSGSEGNQYTVTFVIVGAAGDSEIGGNNILNNDLLQRAKRTAVQLLGRFF